MNRGVAVSVVQKPCAFHPAGATQAFCESVSKIPGKNLDGCCSSNCPSKFRVCRVCVTQNETGVVTSPKDGLCKFHRTNGEASHRASSARVTEDSRSLGWVSTTPSVKKIVTVPKSPNSAPAIRSTAEPVEVIRVPPAPAGGVKRSSVMGRKPNKGYRGIKIADAEVEGGQSYVMPLDLLNTVLAMRDERGLGTKQIGVILGKSQMFVYLILRLEGLVPEVRDLLSALPGQAPQLPVSYAVEVAQLLPEQQFSTAQRSLKGSVSFEQLKALAKDPANRISRKKEIVKSTKPPSEIQARTPIFRPAKKPPKMLLHALDREIGFLAKRADNLQGLYQQIVLKAGGDSATMTLVESRVAPLRKRLLQLLVEFEGS